MNSRIYTYAVEDAHFKLALEWMERDEGEGEIIVKIKVLSAFAAKQCVDLGWIDTEEEAWVEDFMLVSFLLKYPDFEDISKRVFRCTNKPRGLYEVGMELLDCAFDME